MMSKYKIFFSFIIMMMNLSFLTCDNRPLFDEMAENRLKIVLKGTYASNDPRISIMPGGHTDPAIQDDSVDDYTLSTDDSLPTKLLLDIAELRIGKYKFANYRQVFTIPLTHTFFTGDPIDGGDIVLKNDDPTKGPFDKVKMYIRKMFFDSATQYKRNQTTFDIVDDKPEQVFHEQDTSNIFDFNQRQIRSYYDTLRLEESHILNSFPLEIPIPGGLAFDKDERSTVLEIRLVLNNFIKKYETEFFDKDEYNVIHYYAPSDWVNEVVAGDYYIGGNLLAVGRVYEESKAGTITGTSSAAGYVIAIPSTPAYLISEYKVNRGAKRTDNICELPVPPESSLLDSYTSVSAHLEYLLRVERYKDDWQADQAGCTTQTAFETAWNTYIDEVKIPPLATWVGSSGSYTLENVQPGSYDLYETNAPTYGQLFKSTDNFIGPTTVIVTAGSTITQNL